MRWSYGVTCVPERLGTYLPATLASLADAGFPDPALFIDGPKDGDPAPALGGLRGVTVRTARLGAYGNWVLAIWELFVRDAAADRYAIFQDDVAAYRNLRAYLDRQPFPAAGYWNLLTFPENERLCPRVGAPVFPFPGANHMVNNGPRRRGFYESGQSGRGAVALVFDAAGVRALLTYQGGPPAPHADSSAPQHMADRVGNAHAGQRNIDGGVVEAMRKAGRREWVHYPSLVKHTGDVSAIGHNRYPNPTSWLGAGFDALELIGRESPAVPRAAGTVRRDLRAAAGG